MTSFDHIYYSYKKVPSSPLRNSTSPPLLTPQSQFSAGTRANLPLSQVALSRHQWVCHPAKVIVFQIRMMMAMMMVMVMVMVVMVMVVVMRMVRGAATQRWWSDAKSVNFFLSPIGSE